MYSSHNRILPTSLIPTSTMKTIYKSLLSCLVLIAGSITFAQAQLCVNVTATLDEDGTFVLDPNDILNFELQPGQSVIGFPLYFTCEDVYQPTPVTLYIVGDDTTYLCQQDVIVIDNEPPVAKCRSSRHVQLDENGEYKFRSDDLNNNSYDLCTEVATKKIIPDRIRCTDPNPMEVTLIVRDLEGNEASCTVDVSYDDYMGPTDMIDCMDTVKYYFYKYDDETVTYISPRDIWEPGRYGCINDYSIALYEGSILRTDGFVTIDDTLASLTVKLYDLINGGDCTAIVKVIPWDDPCDAANTLLCDTECHSTPIGDCASGHTDQDAVELPCDISISDWCRFSEIDPDPEFLEWYGPPVSENSWPHYGDEFITDQNSFGNIFVGFWDAVTELPTGLQIIRTWTILDWCSQQTIDYAQHITITYAITQVCDTLPWNAPVGDCQSGHTLSDDVEWPADITIHSLFAHPDDLALNPEVQPENVKPQVNKICIGNEVSYHDFAIEINDTTLRVERTWTVTDTASLVNWDYVQVITIIHEGIVSTVCVTTENGLPISGVELIPGVFTDNSGCRVFPDPDGIIVTPFKDSPWEEGITILDNILLVEDILGIIDLSIYEKSAADINNSQYLSTLDFVEFRKILFGINTSGWSDSWRFFEQSTNLGYADISDPLMSYKFIGVKKGDIDNSYLLNPDYEDIILRTEDEVLNAGETYSVPFYLERSENLAGFALRIINENNNIEFLGVTAPNLSGFAPAFDASLSPATLTINWIAPGMNLLTGIPLDSTQPLFILELRATENIILNEHLSLETSYDNILKPAADAPLQIRLAWEDIVISSVAEFDTGRKIEFYPNPASELLHLNGVTQFEKGSVIIMEPAGRIVMKENFHTSIDISGLNAGMYFITFMVDGKKSGAVPMVKL